MKMMTSRTQEPTLLKVLVTVYGLCNLKAEIALSQKS